MSARNRCTWVGDVQIPKPGARGEAFPASGCYDPRSCEYGAWLFVEDGQEDAAYCDPDRDLIFDSAADSAAGR